MKIDARILALVVAGTVGLVALPVLAQTPPSTGAGADLVGGADSPYDNSGVNAPAAYLLGDILSGNDLDMELAANVVHESPPSNNPAIPSLLDDQDNLMPDPNTPSGDAASDNADAGDAAENSGMTAEEYADHMNSNAQQWDDLADQAADPADAARWRKRAAAVRAEALKAYRQAALDALDAIILEAGQTGALNSSNSLADDVADAIAELEVATAIAAVSTDQGFDIDVRTELDHQVVAQGIDQSIDQVGQPQVETPIVMAPSFRIVLTAGPSTQ